MDNTTDLATTAPAPALEGSIVERVELPSGGYAILRDPVHLRAKDKKRVLKQITDVERLVSAGLDVVDGLMLMLIEKWELSYLGSTTPTVEDLEELTIPDYDALTEAVGPAREVLFPGKASVDDMGKKGTPTPPASA